MSRPRSSYESVPTPDESHMNRGYGTNSNTGVADFAQGNPDQTSPLSQSMHHNAGAFTEDLDASQPGSSVVDDGAPGVNRTTSTASTAVPASAPSRNNTLKKRNSVKRTTSLKRSSSKRSLNAGSSVGHGGVRDKKEYYSAFNTPIPTQGAPTEVLANRFQAWRQLLKSLIAYFREIQASYEMRAKATQKVQGAVATITHPAIFMSENGLSEATRILGDYHKRSIAEANKSREIEADVIGALTGLRSDLGQKIKEIKSLSGDFKNSVDKEKDNTRREVDKLQDALRSAEHDDASAMHHVGKNDPFVVKLGVDRAVERQIDEENYLHRAYLNLENSGRELESIVVGEIQKAYNAIAGILKREGDDAHHAVESLRTGPISMPKDAEWMTFVRDDSHFVDPNVPIRRVEEIEYPGKHHPAAAEVRSGMLERKSKYLKSYTPGWYILSPTHLHEFKSADKIYSQPPVMSLYLPDQKLGSHSQPGSSSHKFMLKGKQSGNMHKGHNWVFRAETYDTMMAWFEDMRVLTEKTGEERNAFVRKHARSFSGTDDRGTVSSDGMEEDEADAVPYSADVASLSGGDQIHEANPQRPQPGGRFPSDLQVPRNRGVSTGESSTSSDPDREAIAAAGAIPGSTQLEHGRNAEDPYRLEGVTAGTATATGYEGADSYFAPTPEPDQQRETVTEPKQESFLVEQPAGQPDPSADHSSQYGDWMAPTVASVAGAGVGVAEVNAYEHEKQDPVEPPTTEAPAEVVMPPTNEPPPEVPEKSKRRSSLTSSENVVAFETDRSATEVPVASTSPQNLDIGSAVAPPTTTAGSLGGLEQEGAHETGTMFPKIIRHDTEMSVSQLHVPGEYPKQI